MQLQAPLGFTAACMEPDFDDAVTPLDDEMLAEPALVFIKSYGRNKFG
jgi:hypothetical protein